MLLGGNFLFEFCVYLDKLQIAIWGVISVPLPFCLSLAYDEPFCRHVVYFFVCICANGDEQYVNNNLIATTIGLDF